MIATGCKHNTTKKNGRDRAGKQRIICKECGKSWTEGVDHTLGTLTTNIERASLAVQLLTEGLGVRATGRITKLDLKTILRITVRVGTQIDRMCKSMIQSQTAAHISVDEIWGYCFCKNRLKKIRGYGEHTGDIYTFAAIDTTSKFFLCWAHGKRTLGTCNRLATRLQHAVTGPFDISTDGFKPLEMAIVEHFGSTVNYGKVIKIFGQNKSREAAARYSPAPIIQIRKQVVCGNPDPNWIQTSHSERANLTLRMTCRRLTRLTNSFSRKWDNHCAGMALAFGVYNFCKTHSTTGTTPAVAQEICEEPWTVRKLIEESSKY